MYGNNKKKPPRRAPLQSGGQRSYGKPPASRKANTSSYGGDSSNRFNRSSMPKRSSRGMARPGMNPGSQRAPLGSPAYGKRSNKSGGYDGNSMSGMMMKKLMRKLNIGK